MTDPPDPYEVMLFLRDWLGPGVGASALYLVWRASRGFTEMKKDHDALEGDHDETKKKVLALEERVAAAREAIAGLATKDDLDRLGERMLAQIATNFGHMLSILGAKKEP